MVVFRFLFPRTSWTLDLDLTLESLKRESGRLEKEPLPSHLEKVLKAEPGQNDTHLV